MSFRSDGHLDPEHPLGAQPAEGLAGGGQTGNESVVPAGEARRGGDRALILDALRQADEATAAWSAGGSAPVAFEEGDTSGPVVFPGYTVTGEIHRGGQGVVYKATQSSTGRTVAIKLMHRPSGLVGEGLSREGLGKIGRARFEFEVQVLGRLDHPGIVRVHDSGVTEGGSVYYVMDYVSGDPLDTVIRSWRVEREREALSETVQGSEARTSVLGGRSLRSRLELFVKICDGVSAAHIAGVIHRDLKPANIRLDARGEPVLVDFGLAKMLDGVAQHEMTMTQTGQFIGSLPWSSPEQADGAGRSVDTRADVYSLGVILYQMVTSGRFPYSVVGSARAVMDTIANEEPRRPSLYDRGINDEIETIILKALSKSPDRRYQTAGEFARDVRRYLDGEAIEAKRDSTWYVMTKTIRRHRVSAGFVAALVLMGTGFSVALAAKYTEAESLRTSAVTRAESESEARQQAELERARAEANFQAVHDLSRLFLFEFHDRIEHLRGAGGARALLVENAREYLDRLRAQSESDPDPVLLLDLAGAYDRLADIQSAYASGRGANTADAVVSLDHAAAIREQLLDLTPGDPALWLSIAHGSVHRALLDLSGGDFEGAINGALSGLDAVARATELGGSSASAHAARAELCQTLGDLEQRTGQAASEYGVAREHFVSALNWYEQADKALNHSGGGEPEFLSVALRRARVNSEIARRMFRAANGDAAGLGDAETKVRVGLQLAESTADRFASLHAMNTADRELLRDLVRSLTEVSFAWETLGQIQIAQGADGLEAKERAFGAATDGLEAARLLAADQSDLDAQRLFGIAMNKVGNALRYSGRFDEAASLYSELVAQRRAILLTDPTPRHTRDLGLALFKRAQIDGNLAQASDSVEVALELLHAAESGYLEARAVFESFAANGTPADRELRQVDRALAGVRGVLSNLDSAAAQPQQE